MDSRFGLKIDNSGSHSSGGGSGDTYYERMAAAPLALELDTDKITIITGPRQSGKTTLLEGLRDALTEQNLTVHYYNFDRSADLSFFKDQQKVEAFLKIRSLKSKLFILIDEVQRKKDAGTFFKYFYDDKLNVKFVFSGSSSLELLDNFGDALTGRKRQFTLLPLAVREIGRSRLGKDEFELLEHGEPQAQGQFNAIAEEALVWGGYPEVVVKATEQAKFIALSELYESYVQRDVKDLLRVKNVEGFNLLVKLLAHRVGEAIVVEELVRQTGMHANTVNSYLDILEGTLIIGRTDNFNPDLSDKLPKSKRFYFLDNGLRNYALGQLQTDFRPDARQLAANLVFAELNKLAEYIRLLRAGGAAGKDDWTFTDFSGSKKSSDPTNSANSTDNSILTKPFSVNHFHTYSDNHVDFILSPQTGGSFTPITVRYGEHQTKLGKKIHEFINTHSPGKFIIITGKTESGEVVREQVKGCEVISVPLGVFLANPGGII